MKVQSNDWNDPTKVEALEGIKYLLNYLEFVAIAIRKGDLDENTMRESLGGMTDALVDLSYQYILYARGELGEDDGYLSSRAYENLLWLRQRWKDWTPRKASRVTERVTIRQTRR